MESLTLRAFSIQEQSCQCKMTKYFYSPSKEVEMEVIATGSKQTSLSSSLIMCSEPEMETHHHWDQTIAWQELKSNFWFFFSFWMSGSDTHQETIK